MKAKKISLIAWALAAACSANATDVSIEGQYLLFDVVQASIETNCLLKFYAAENASGPLYETNDVRFATDVNGCFVIHASAPDFVELPDTFWVGVTPAGRGELAPRFRVAPVPFAFAADEAQLVSLDNELALAGVATIDRLDVSGDVEAEVFVVATNSVVKTRNLRLDSAKVMSLAVPDGGLLGLFNAKGATPSFDYDTFSAEKQASVEARVTTSGMFDFYINSYTQDASADWTFDRDGFLTIAVKADPKKCPAPKLTVAVGATKILDNRTIGTDRGSAVKRFMTVPYRAGEHVSVKVTAVGAGEHANDWWGGEKSDYKASIGVKARLMRFGRD